MENYDINSHAKVAEVSGGTDTTTELFRFLLTPNLTGQEIQDYSVSVEGMAQWANLVSIPKSILTETLLPEIRKCQSVFQAAQNNTKVLEYFPGWDWSDIEYGTDLTTKVTEIGDMGVDDYTQWLTNAPPGEITDLLGSLPAFNKVCANSAKSNLFVNDTKFMTLLSKHELGSHIACAHVESVSAMAASMTGLSIVATSKMTLRFLFEKMSNREIIFDTGGKQAADILMRGSSDITAFLRDEFAQTITHGGNTDGTIASKGYLLVSKVDRRDDDTQYTHKLGMFSGDYQSGYVTLGTPDTYPVNERVDSYKCHVTHWDNALKVSLIWIVMS